jgi:O-antigen/teichoic acid export membrane protein
MSRLSRNVLYNAAGQIAVALLGFVAVKYLYDGLGADGFGLVSVGLVFNAVVTSCLELGLASVVVREVARLSTAGRAYVHDLIRTCATIYWGLTALLAVIAYAVTPALLHRWLHTSSDTDQAVTALRILLISGLLGLPRTLYNSVLRGEERMGASNAIEVVARTAQTAGIVLVARAGGGLVAVSTWIAAVYAGVLVAYVAMIARSLPLSAMVPAWKGYTLRRNARFAGGTGVLSVTAVVQTQADKVVLSRSLPVADVGYYTFGAGLLSRAQLLVLAVAEASLPSLTRALGDAAAWRARYDKLQDLVVYCTLPAFALLTFAIGPVDQTLFGARVAADLILPMGLLSLGLYLNATLTVPYMLSVAMGRSGIAARSNVIAMVTALPATVVLVLRFGLVGAAASWLLYDLLGYAYMLPRIASSCLQVRTVAWFIRLARVAPGLGVYGIGWYLLAYHWGNSPLAAAAAWALSSAVYLPAAVWGMGSGLRGLLARNGGSAVRSIRQHIVIGGSA